MIKKVSKNEMRKVRHERIRENLSGTSERPRLCVFRSNANIEAQIIDDVKGVTLASATTLEKDLKSLIKQYKLKDKFYYVNLDGLKDNANKISAVNELLGLTEVQVTKVPTIIYVTNGEIKKGNIIMRLDDNLFEKGDFQQLLDINDL